MYCIRTRLLTLVSSRSTADLPLWLQTDGVVEWVQDFIRSRKLHPPSVTTAQTARGLLPEADSLAALSAEANDGVRLTGADLHDMYRDMFTTAFEIIQDSV